VRQAAEPLTSRDIALELLVTRALDKVDQKLLALKMRCILGKFLENYSERATEQDD
jgi:hypothetical protein